MAKSRYRRTPSAGARPPFSKRQPREKKCRAPFTHHNFIPALDLRYEVCERCGLPRKKGEY